MRKNSYIPGTDPGNHYLVVFKNDSYVIGIRYLGGESYRVRIIERDDVFGNLSELACTGTFSLKGDHISGVCEDVVKGIETAVKIINQEVDTDDDTDKDTDDDTDKEDE